MSRLWTKWERLHRKAVLLWLICAPRSRAWPAWTGEMYVWSICLPISYWYYWYWVLRVAQTLCTLCKVHFLFGGSHLDCGAGGAWGQPVEPRGRGAAVEGADFCLSSTDLMSYIVHTLFREWYSLFIGSSPWVWAGETTRSAEQQVVSTRIDCSSSWRHSEQ